ncbi:MAG: ABC transporter permease [Alphaproteobacteria bacterium]|nr:ABC transporter permease [Alphaproteobacteria bacterium]
MGTAVAVDGFQLAEQFKRSGKRARRGTFLLVLPLLAFLTVSFILPIASMLNRSVEDGTVSQILPRTAAALRAWNGKGRPPFSAYSALADDLVQAQLQDSIGKVATRMNFERAGMRSLLIKTARVAQTFEPPYAQAFNAVDLQWSDPEVWGTLRHASALHTAGYYAAAVDETRKADGTWIEKPEDEQVYIMLFQRTLWIATVVTLLCFLLGYPLAYYIAHQSERTRNLLLILVLLPFWTSLLVRTTSWIVLLQTNGLVNDGIALIGGEGARLELIHNMTGTLIAMTHVLLPFMILPTYSVMLSVPPQLTRAAVSLGATPWTAFWRVYFPMTLPGAAAGGLLVFILALGYYITPALVGGRTGQMISNMIEFHMKTSLNWGLAAALGGILLGGVVVLYIAYARLIGLNRLRLG